MLSWEHLLEYSLQIAVRRRLRDSQQLERFDAVKGRYSEVCNILLNGIAGSRVVSDGYDWTSWAASIRQAFQNGVPLGFLRNPMLSQTMVFARRRGIRLTRTLLKTVLAVYGNEAAATLLREDYVGLPTITSAAYMTSANRCHHASHLASYAQQLKRNFWDCTSIVEWGGGYGNMARIIRRMNPLLTYSIVDLPELLALQYVYLSSMEGESNVHVVHENADRGIAPGKINLLTSQVAAQMDSRLRCDGFVSTWAITESPRDAQEFVLSKEFFGAGSVLLGSLVNQNNYLADSVEHMGLSRVPVPTSRGVGPGHEYWFR